MCFKKPNCDSVRDIEEEEEEGGGIVFDGGLDVEEDDEYDDDMWGHMGMALGGPATVLGGTVQPQVTLPSPGETNLGPELQITLQSSLRTVLQSSLRTVLQSSLQTVLQSQTLLQSLTLLQSPIFLQTLMDDTAHMITHMAWLGGLGWEEIFGDTTVEEMVIEAVREVAREVEAASGPVRVGVDNEEEENDASQSPEDAPSMKPTGLIESEEEETCSKDPHNVTGSKEEEEQKPLGLWAEDELDSDDDALLLQAVLELEEQGAPGLEGSLVEVLPLAKSKEVDSDDKAIMA